jgi:hypothetical protein
MVNFRKNHNIRQSKRTHRNSVAQRKSDALGFATDADMAGDGTRLCPLDAQICKGIFA